MQDLTPDASTHDPHSPSASAQTLPEGVVLTSLPSQAEALKARYGDHAPPSGPWNGVLAQLVSHRSVRTFLSTPLPQNTLESLVAAAQSAATSSNLQTWSVVAVESPARKAHLAELAGDQDFIRQAPLFLVWLADLSRVDAIARARSVKLEALDYLETAVVALIDAALAAQNAVIAAESLGLGAVYVGAIRNRPQEVAAVLRLPPLVFPAIGLALGWPNPEHPASVKPRLPQVAILSRETYDVPPQAGAAAAYDKVLEDFWRKQGFAHPAWTEHVLTRLGKTESLNGRHRLAEALRAAGFVLR